MNRRIPRPQNPTYRAGFTLIELVAVILVLAILGGIAIPRYINHSQRAKDSADAGALAGINTALGQTFMSNRSTGADSSKWVTSIGSIAGVMETGALPGGWTVDGSQLIDLRGNRYDFIAETADAQARIIVPGTTVPGGSGWGGGGGGGGGSARTSAEVQAMTTAQILASNLTPGEFALLTAEQLAGLTPEELGAFSNDHIAALTASQFTGLSYAQVEFISARVTTTQIPLLRPDQLAMLSATAYAALSPSQRAAMTADQVAERAVSEDARARNFEGIRTLPVAAIKYLLASQVSAIGSDYAMGLLSADRRAAFTADQVKAINTAVVSLAYLTDAQRLNLTAAQVGAIRTDDIRYVPATRITEVPPATIGQINSDYAMGLISADRRAAFGAAQIQALNSTNVSISYLTEAQRNQLTTAQVAAIRTDDIRHLPAGRMSEVPPATFAAINSDYAMGLISSERRAAFSAAQVQALNSTNVSISYLTETQRDLLTTAQVAAIRTDDIRHLPTGRMGEVPPATFAAINSDYAMGLISSERRAAFSAAQVQALNTAVVSLGYLTESQRSQTTTAQMAAIRVDDIRHVPVGRFADVPAATVGQIGSDYAMGLISSERRAAFSAAQVQALNTAVVSLGYLTDAQREQTTSAQLAAIRTDDVRHVPVSRMGDVTTAAVGGIGSDYAMGLVSAERRAAFNTAQVQALNTAVVSLSYLTDAQREQVTTGQMSSIRASDVRHAAASRVSEIPTATIAAISSAYEWGLVSTPRVQALSQAQIMAIPQTLYDGIRSRLTAQQQAWR